MSSDPSDLIEERQETMPPIDHDIELRAVRVSPERIDIIGDGRAELKRDSGHHNFNFTLTDETTANVRFNLVTSPTDPRPLLWARNESETCPPPPNSQSDQIDKVRRTSDTEASFRDKNSNRKPDVPVSYQLNFVCDDSKVTEPIIFDPIIRNGGSTGP